jgi:hypothetical protein
VYYVDGENGADPNDGLTWDTAKATIQAAVDAALTDDEIWVKSGTYAISSQIQVDKAVGIYGGFAGDETERNQRDRVNNVTVIDGQGGTRILRSSDEPVIDGFSLINGHYDASTDPEQGGGALYLGGFGSGNKIARISNCIMSGNTEYSDDPAGNPGFKGGGAIFVGAGKPVFTNCLIINNSTNAYGGAVNIYSGAPDFINCTISNNTALEGGGIYIKGDDSVVIDADFYNCIVRGNEAGDANDLKVIPGGDAPQGSNNCSSVEIGSGTILADPLFIDPNDGNYHLQAGSPCIDAGSNSSIPAGINNDLDGRPRFINDPDTGVGLTPVVDIGVYELGDLHCGLGDLAYPIGDLNLDCSVNFVDLAFFTSCWLTQDGEPGWDNNCNLHYADLTIDEDDIVVFAENWLDSTVPSQQLARWMMDDNADNTLVLDSSVNETDGTAQENTSVLHATGVIGGALMFNGSDYVDCGDSELFDLSGAFSLAAWVKPDNTDNWERVIGRYDLVSDSGYFLGKTSTDDGVWEFATWVAGNKVVIKSTSVPTGDWQFVVGTRDADGDMKLYVDGVLEPQLGTNAGAIDSSGDLLIGANYTLTNAFFGGLIDEVRIFDEALSAGEILGLYNQGGL